MIPVPNSIDTYYIPSTSASPCGSRGERVDHPKIQRGMGFAGLKLRGEQNA